MTYNQPAWITEPLTPNDCTCEQGPEWSGSPDPDDPDNSWLCDECGRTIEASDASIKAIRDGLTSLPPKGKEQH